MSTARTCAIRGCVRKHAAKGFCGSHYWRMKNGVSLDAPINDRTPTPDTCSVSGCEKATRSTTAVLCDMHYVRQWRHGDLNVGEAPVGERRTRPDGYIKIKTENGWELEHRVVAEQMIGRPLDSWEHVHHIDGSRDNNRPENLVVYTNAEHQRVHKHWESQVKPRVALTCHWCGSGYTKKPSRVGESKYCSNDCRMQAMWDARRRKAAERRQT